MLVLLPFARGCVCLLVCPLSQWLARLDVIFDEYDIVWQYLQGCYSFLVYIHVLGGLCIGRM